MEKYKIQLTKNTLGNYSAEYELMRKWMVKFIIKFQGRQGRGLKIARVTSIRVAKPLIFFNILLASHVTSTCAKFSLCPTTIYLP